MDLISPIDAYAPLVIVSACLVMTGAGFVKGAVGFALPMLAIGGLGSFLSAQETVAVMILPTFLSNFWQTLRQGLGPAAQTARQFWKLNLVLGLTIGLAAQMVPRVSSGELFVFLGLMVSALAALQLAGWQPRAPDGDQRRAAIEVVTGLVAGICGGLSGAWGPPVLFFLIALQTEKTLQIRALGLAFTVGSMILVPAHLASGILNGRTLPLSFLLCLPTVAGMLAGLRWQDRMDQKLFRRATLVVLCVAGLNLLRRGLL